MSVIIGFILGVIAGTVLAVLIILFVFGATRYDRRDEPPSKDDWRGLD